MRGARRKRCCRHRDRRATKQMRPNPPVPSVGAAAAHLLRERFSPMPATSLRRFPCESGPQALPTRGMQVCSAVPPVFTAKSAIIRPPKPPLFRGEVSEWLKEHAWKACLGASLTWVRIPSSPPAGRHARYAAELFYICSPSRQWVIAPAGLLFRGRCPLRREFAERKFGYPHGRPAPALPGPRRPARCTRSSGFLNDAHALRNSVNS